MLKILRLLKRKKDIKFDTTSDFINEITKLNDLRSTFDQVKDSDSIDQMIYLIKAQEISVSKIIKNRKENLQNA